MWIRIRIRNTEIGFRSSSTVENRYCKVKNIGALYDVRGSVLMKNRTNLRTIDPIRTSG
jgi:hypothetical protein